MTELTGMDVVMRGLDAWATGTRKAAGEAALEIAAMLQEYARGHHAWKPETGYTDLTTFGQVKDIESDLILIILSAGMDYDKFLELVHEGKWAWIWPAVVENQEKIRRILKRKLSEVRVLR